MGGRMIVLVGEDWVAIVCMVTRRWSHDMWSGGTMVSVHGTMTTFHECVLYVWFGGASASAGNRLLYERLYHRLGLD